MDRRSNNSSRHQESLLARFLDEAFPAEPGSPEVAAPESPSDHKDVGGRRDRTPESSDT